MPKQYVFCTSSKTRGGGRGRVVEVDVDVDVECRCSRVKSRIFLVEIGTREGSKEASRQASSTQGNRRLSFEPWTLRPWDLGAWEPVGRPGPCGMVEQARTREQTALGWLFWGGWEAGKLGAGSREAGGAWARAGLVHRRGDLGPGPGLGACGLGGQVKAG